MKLSIFSFRFFEVAVVRKRIVLFKNDNFLSDIQLLIDDFETYTLMFWALVYNTSQTLTQHRCAFVN